MIAILENIRNLNGTVAIYYYIRGSYEGSGKLIWLKNNKWYYNDLGHCSCYGPTDSLGDDVCIGENIEEVKKKLTEELYQQIEPLIDIAIVKGYISSNNKIKTFNLRSR